MPYSIEFDSGYYTKGPTDTDTVNDGVPTHTRRVEFTYFRTYSEEDRRAVAKLACGESYQPDEYQIVTRVPSDTMLAVQLRAQFSLIGLTYVMRAQDPNSIVAASDNGSPSLEDLIDTVEANKHLASYFGELVGI